MDVFKCRLLKFQCKTSEIKITLMTFFGGYSQIASALKWDRTNYECSPYIQQSCNTHELLRHSFKESSPYLHQLRTHKNCAQRV